MYLPFDPVILLLGMYLTDTSALIKMIYVQGYSLLLCLKSKRLETTQVSISRGVGNETMVHAHNGILGSCKKPRDALIEKDRSFNLVL